MLRRVWGTVLLATGLLVAVGAVVGVVAEPSGGLRGAAVGLAVAVAAGVHLAVRTLSARTPEASGPPYSPESVERQVIATAFAQVAPDAIGIAALLAIGGLLIDDAGVLRLLPVVGLVAVLVDLGLRVRRQWLLRVGTDAQ